jgi:4-amino-4-deoxy-L-arabinose transferase-like glycosyltransferase
MNILSMKRETTLLVLQVVCTLLGIFFSLILMGSAVYIGDLFYGIAIVTGILCAHEAGRQKNWRARLTSLLVIGVDIFMLSAIHGLEAVAG